MDIQELARVGATHRFNEIQGEMSSLVKMFPELNGHEPKKRGRPPVARFSMQGTQFEAPTKRKMSRKARAAISVAQKARWAKKHKVKTEKTEQVLEGESKTDSKRIAGRKKSAELLAIFNGTPTTIAEVVKATGMVTGRFRGLGSLVRRGYLKKRRKGYIRTAKEFTV